MIIAALLLSVLSFGDTTTIELQNGLNGYTGCEDSFNHTAYADTNHSTYGDLQIFNCIP